MSNPAPHPRPLDKAATLPDDRSVTQPPTRNTGAFMAFLVMCFLIVGLAGLFGTYATPIPLERALAQDTALDEALATGGAAPALAALRERLGDSATMVIDGAGPLADRVATARAAMHVAQQQAEAAVASRLRMLLIVITVIAAGFGAALLGLAARRT